MSASEGAKGSGLGNGVSARVGVRVACLGHLGGVPKGAVRVGSADGVPERGFRRRDGGRGRAVGRVGSPLGGRLGSGEVARHP